MSRVVNDQQMIGARIIKKGRHLHAELNAGVGDSRNSPSIGLELVPVAKYLLQGK